MCWGAKNPLSGVPKTTPGLVILQDPHRTLQIVRLTAKIYYSKGHKAKSAKGKEPRVESRGDRRKLPRVSPSESHGTHLLPPATSCDNTRDLSSMGEMGLSLGAQGFWGDSLAYTKIQTPRRKAGAQHEPRGLCQQSGYTEPSLSLSGLQDTMAQSSAQMPATASLAAVSHLLGEPFLHRPRPSTPTP